MLKQTLALAGLTLSLSANAAIVDLGNITRDTSTGLDWLDVTLTQGMSINHVEGVRVIVKSGVQGSESSGDLINLCYLDSISKFDSSNHLCQVLESA